MPIVIFFPFELSFLSLIPIEFPLLDSEFIDEDDFELLLELRKSHSREESDWLERLKDPNYFCVPKAEDFLLESLEVWLERFLEDYLRLLRSFFNMYSASALFAFSGILLSFRNKSYSLLKGSQLILFFSNGITSFLTSKHSLNKGLCVHLIFASIYSTP